MKKWKLREAAVLAERRADSLAAEVAMLKRRVEDMRANWAPVPIAHEWQPKNPQCMFCDEPREAARHQVQR